MSISIIIIYIFDYVFFTKCHSIDQISIFVLLTKTIVKKLSDRGIYTMLDMHQDCLTSKYQAYDGVPRWLVDTYPKPTNPFPWPFVSIGAWEEKYLTQESIH